MSVGCCVKLRGQVYGRASANCSRPFVSLGNVREVEIRPTYLPANYSARSRENSCADAAIARVDLSFEALSWSPAILSVVADARFEDYEAPPEAQTYSIMFPQIGTYPLPPAKENSFTLLSRLVSDGALSPVNQDQAFVKNGVLHVVSETPLREVLVAYTPVDALCFSAFSCSAGDVHLRFVGEDCFSGETWNIDIWRVALFADSHRFLHEGSDFGRVSGRVKRVASQTHQYYRAQVFDSKETGMGLIAPVNPCWKICRPRPCNTLANVPVMQCGVLVGYARNDRGVPIVDCQGIVGYANAKSDSCFSVPLKDNCTGTTLGFLRGV